MSSKQEKNSIHFHIYGPSSLSNSRSLEQGSLQKGPQTKLPTYDGQDIKKYTDFMRV